MKRLLLPIAALALSAGPAAAHHPVGGAMPATAMEGLLSGLGHPVIGLDHLAFLLGLALVAGLAGWGAMRVVIFVLASLAGVATAWMGLALPEAEVLVALSVIAIGIALLARVEAPAGAWAALLAVAGLAHGQAFAEAVIGAEATPVLSYLAGLALVQAALALGIARLVAERPSLGLVPRLAGLVVMVTGAAALLA
jgi:urease accessory protein